MKILLLTWLFQPEPNHLKGLAYAKELVRSGHEVEVLTGFPNYPSGKVYDGYRIRWRTRELIGEVPVVRVAHYPSHSRSGLGRSLCYLSFAASACLFGPFVVKRPDVVHVYQGPATLALPAILMRLLFRVPFVLDVQDLWPDSVASSGMLKSSLGLAVLGRLCKFGYRCSRKIVVLSAGYKEALEKRGVPPEKIEVLHNWCDESQVQSAADYLDRGDTFGLEGRFNVVFAGTMGKVQALDAVLDAATLLQDELPQVQFVLVGGGIEAARLQTLAAQRGLAGVRFIPWQPADKIGTVLLRADALLIHLRDDPLGRIAIPQKTQAYMAAGRPIILAARGDAADLVQRARAGIVCEPENPQSIADAVRSLVLMPREARQALGVNGKNFYARELCFAVGVRRMVSILEEAGKP